MLSKSPTLIVTVIAFALAGCAARQKPATNWQLRPVGEGHMLVPPLPLKGRLVRLDKARSIRNASPACNVAISEVQLSWRGATAQVAVSPEAIGPLGKVIVTGGKGPLVGEPLRDLAWWTRFGKELEQREQSGCLAQGEAERLMRRIVENLALPSSLAYELRYGSHLMMGYLDLESQFSLKSVAPLGDGFETVNYDLKPDRGGVKLVLRSVEHNIGGKLSNPKRASAQLVALPDSARYVRYFFRTWKIAGDRKIALLAASRPELLDPLTKQFEADPESFCRSLKAAQASCIAIPADTILTPEMMVRANGKAAPYVLGRGTVGSVLHSAGVRQPQDVVHSLVVRRPYGGQMLPVEFDRARGDILSLVLIGGEELRW
jgi:hypothetical protein